MDTSFWGFHGSYDEGTTPRDFREGLGDGDKLFPQSLYLSQLNRRVGAAPGISFMP